MAKPSHSDLAIYFLDVGQGDCTVVVPPVRDAGVIVFDVADQYVLGRFISDHELRVSDVVLSHLDEDHIRGAADFLRQHTEEVDRVYLWLDRGLERGKNEGLRELIDQVTAWGRTNPPTIILKENWRDHEATRVIRADEDTDWKVEIVLPYNTARLRGELGHARSPNAASAVLRVQRAGTAVLIGGDAPLGSWEDLNEYDPGLVPAAAIRVPHHGGNAKEGGRTWKEHSDLYRHVRADLAVISVGSNNPPRWSHPREDHVAAIRRDGACRLLCTQLTPRCHEVPTTLRQQLLEQAGMVEFPYRHWDERGNPLHLKEVPCAGTIVVWIDAGGTLHHEPAQESAHTRMLMRIDRPMCT